MMFVFGGVPNIYYERLLERAKKELPNDVFTGVPLYPSSGNAYVVTNEHCRDLILGLARYVEGRPNCIENGVGVVLALRAWERRSFRTTFAPLALCTEPRLDLPIKIQGEAARQVANQYATDVLASAERLRRPVRALMVELEVQLRRTPLLLPVRHFGSLHLDALLVEVSRTVEAAKPDEALRAACDRFRSEHPFNASGRGGAYVNPVGVKFAVPGRNDFHGRRRSIEAPHNERCFLGARIRMGGYYVDGFHYDCTRGKSNYAGQFANCHDEVGDYKGRPHLNVFPNDFIR
jgi:hypothetical protein